MTPRDEPLTSIGVQNATGEGQRNSSRKKRLGQSENEVQLWMSLVVKVKSDAVKNNTE